jgi:hypothetical protein
MQRHRRVVKIYEISHPYYYCELETKAADRVSQIGSLSRLTGFLNAAHRVRLM